MLTKTIANKKTNNLNRRATVFLLRRNNHKLSNKGAVGLRLSVGLKSYIKVVVALKNSRVLHFELCTSAKILTIAKISSRIDKQGVSGN